MAVGKGSIKRAAKAADTAVTAAPAKEVVEAIVEKAPVKKTTRRTPAKRTAAKKTADKAVNEAKNIGIGTELPTYLL